jgi:hypothetical protein
LDAAAGEESVARDEKGVNPFARKSSKGGIDVTARAGVANMDLKPKGASSFLHLF